MRGLASSPFDSEGVRTQDLEIITDGVLATYLLTSYAARKMNMTPTGHAGGIHNWYVKSTGQNYQQMLKELGTGLLVTEVMGQGVNVVTGDYSRGAAGFWVENGEIKYLFLKSPLRVTSSRCCSRLSRWAVISKRAPRSKPVLF